MADIIHHIIFLKEDKHWNAHDAMRLLEEKQIEYVDYEETDEVICFNTDKKSPDTKRLRLLPLTPLVFLLLTDLEEENEKEDLMDNYMETFNKFCKVNDCDKTICDEGLAVDAKRYIFKD